MRGRETKTQESCKIELMIKNIYISIVIMGVKQKINSKL